MSTLTITLSSDIAIRFRRHCRLLGLTTSEAATQALIPWIEMQDDALEHPEAQEPPDPVTVASVVDYEPPTITTAIERVNEVTSPLGITVTELEVLP